MKNATGGLSDQIADAASDIGSAAQDEARHGLKRARANAGAMVADASDRLGAAAERAQSQASSLADTIEETVRERPLSSLVLALGFGFLAGVVWRR